MATNGYTYTRGYEVAPADETWFRLKRQFGIRSDHRTRLVDELAIDEYLASANQPLRQRPAFHQATRHQQYVQTLFFHP